MRTFISHPVVVTVLKVLVSMLLLGGLITYIDFGTMYRTFVHADTYYLGIGLCLAVSQLVVHFYRWRYLLRLVSKEISNFEVFTSFFVGFMTGFFTPAQLGEFAGRIASHPHVNKSHIIGITLIDKLYLASLTFIIGGTGLSMLAAEHFPEYWSPVYTVVVGIFIVILIAISLLPEKVKYFLTFLPEKIRLHRFYEMIQVIEREFHAANALRVFALTSLLYSILLFEFYFLAKAFGEISLVHAMICAASVFFVKSMILPISFGDLGVRESAAVFFFEKVGAGAAMAFNASLLMSFTNVIVPTAIGAILVMRLKRS